MITITKKNLESVLKAVTNDEMRTNLMAVNFRQGIAECTNGHWLAQVPYEGMDEACLSSQDIFQGLAILKAIKMPSKHLQHETICFVKKENVFEMYSYCVPEHKTLLGVVKPSEGQFPDTKAVIPANETITFEVCLSSEVLQGIINAVKTEKKIPAFINLAFTQDQRPFFYKSGNVFGVGMPARGEPMKKKTKAA